MKHISILIPHGHTSMVNIEGTHQIFSQVNLFLKKMGRPEMFKIQLVGLAKKETQTTGLFTINPDILLEDVQKTDLIIIPAIHGNHRKNLENNRAFIPWMIEQHKQGTELASFCIGTFFLAQTGLLKGKQCATHWASAHEFRKMFPEVHLVDDKIMTAENGIYTSGGAYSYLNLLLYLIEKYVGREMAILISKTYMIDIDKESQLPFIIFQGQREHKDEPIKKAQEFIEKNYESKINVDRLAEMFALSRRNLERRFKKATHNTIVEYVQRVKIEVAKKALETGKKNVNEVMFEVGYADDKAFRNTFKKIAGVSPLQYRNRYNQMLEA